MSDDIVGMVVSMPNTYDEEDKIDEYGYRGTIVAVVGPLLLVRVEYELGQEYDAEPIPPHLRIIPMLDPQLRLFRTIGEWREWQDYWNKEKWR